MHKVSTTTTYKNPSVALAIALVLITGCNPKPEPIVIGKDACVECKMTIMDPKFGGEIVTKKGKVYKFDDTHCIAAFFKRRGVEMSDIHSTLFLHYNGSGQFVPVKDVEFIVSQKLKSPMNGNAAAFSNKAEAERVSSTIEGSKSTNWATLYNILIK